jgi:hypothetical protein
MGISAQQLPDLRKARALTTEKSKQKEEKEEGRL